MKYIFAVFLLASSQAFVVDDAKNNVKKPPTPVLLSMTALDPPSFQVTWSELKNIGDEPVLGYKVYVWELEDVLKTVYHVKEDQVVPVEERDNPSIHKYKPVAEAHVITVEGPENTSATYSPAKVNVQYQVRVAAFTKQGDGALSSQSLGLKLHDDIPTEPKTKIDY